MTGSKKNNSDFTTTANATSNLATIKRLKAGRLTGVGKSAVAVIGVRGEHAGDAIFKCFTRVTKREIKQGEICFGHWHGHFSEEDKRDSRCEPIESESVVVVMKQPDYFEVHCHGGTAAIDRMMVDLTQAGASRIDVQDDPMMRQITMKSLLESEACEVLSRCRTIRTAAIALAQCRDGLEQWAKQWIAKYEAEDQAEGNRGRLYPALQREIESMLAFAPVTTRLNRPFRVVLCGRPNVGKSSLINAIVGYDHSITTPIAGTTRDILHADTAVDGVPIRLSDTAGIHQSDEPIEKEGIRRAIAEAEEADLVLLVRDHDYDFVSKIKSNAPQIRLWNKVDCLESVEASESIVYTSATDGTGIPELLDRISSVFTQRFPPPNSPVVLNSRQHTCLCNISENSDPIPPLRELITGTL